jgi:hypothetical protein
MQHAANKQPSFPASQARYRVPVRHPRVFDIRRSFTLGLPLIAARSQSSARSPSKSRRKL